MATAEWSISETLLENWNGKGKEDILDLLKRTWKSVATTIVSKSSSLKPLQGLAGLVHDLLLAGIKGVVEVEEVAALLKRAKVNEKIFEIPSVTADGLALLDIQVQCEGVKSDIENFKHLVEALSDVTPEGLLKERLDPDTLVSVGLVSDSKSFSSRSIKMKTRLFYKQQKFNLLREEMEGYSKLISELSSLGKSYEAPSIMSDNIKSLIGQFSLDPNRVLDVMLEAFECHLEEQDFYVSLLKMYPYERETFLSMLAFKFKYYQTNLNGYAAKTPPSLYQMTALLIEEGFVQLQEMFTMLAPSMEVINSEFGEITKEAQATARKINRVTLTATTEEGKDKETSDNKFIIQSKDALSVNQKLGLCHALIQSCNWSASLQLIDNLPPGYALMCEDIRVTVTQHLHAMIAPLYKECTPKAARSRPVPSVAGLLTCRSHKDLPPVCFELLYRLGCQLSKDAVLMAKVLRIARELVRTYNAAHSSDGMVDQELERAYSGTVTLLDETLLPSLALLSCNCSMGEEVWLVLKTLPYDIRFRLYGCWKNKNYDSHPELVVVKANILSRAKYIMKRITKDNVKQCGRQLGKLSHSSPGVVFDYILSQIQNFDNLIVPCVDSLKYLSPLGYDVLSYCIIEALASPTKERLKYDDTTVSQWLQGLATFCGTVYKKYPLELTGLLQFVANQLKIGKSFDLLILKEVIQKMSGIEISEDLTPSQLEAMAGFDLLKAEGAYFSQIRNIKRSSQRLKETLVESDLGLPLAILIGQQRDSILYAEGEKHVKLLGMLYDYCMETLIQFGWFLEAHLSVAEYASNFDLQQLQQNYHLPTEIAFFLIRPKLTNNIKARYSERQAACSEKKSSKDGFCAAVDDVLRPISDTVKALQPAKVWDDMSVHLFVTFWSLNLNELYVPVGRYDEELAKLKQTIHEIEGNPDLSSSKKKKEIERCNVTIQRLKEECSSQEAAHKLMVARFEREKDSWFSSIQKNKNITQFLQLCIFPRSLFTAQDAVFCARFVQMLHKIRTPNFSTLLFFDRIFADISYTTAMCTENEARRYGRFLGLLLEVISRWHYDSEIYDKECNDTPGFIHNVRGGASEAGKNSLDFENFRHICFKWHFKITKSLVTCLESKDYQQCRNALIIMTKLLPQYPKVYHLSQALEKRVSQLQEEEKEKRPDLHVLALGYAGLLRNHKSNLIQETDFHIKEERVKHAEQQKHDSSSIRGINEPSGGSDHGDDDKQSLKVETSRHQRRSPVPKSHDDSRLKPSKELRSSSKERRERDKEGVAKLISSREEGRSGSKDRPGGGRQSGAGDTRGKSRDAVVGGRSSKTETKSSKLDQKSVKEDSKTAISKDGALKGVKPHDSSGGGHKGSDTEEKKSREGTPSVGSGKRRHPGSSDQESSGSEAKKRKPDEEREKVKDEKSVKIDRKRDHDDKDGSYDSKRKKDSSANTPASSKVPDGKKEDEASASGRGGGGRTVRRPLREDDKVKVSKRISNQKT